MDYRYNWFRVKLKGFNNLALEEFVFRGLNKREAILFEEKKEKDPYQAETYVLETAVQGDYPWDDAPGGTALCLVELVLQRSVGFSETMWEKASKYFSSETGMMESMAVAVLPSVDFRTLSTCDTEDYAKYVLFGLQLFETIYPDSPLLYQLRGGSSRPSNSNQFGSSHTEMNYPGKPGEVGTETTSFSWSKG